jgi:hypothetical protein
MLELIETIAAASGSIPEKRRLDARAFEKPRDPSLDPRIQLDLRAVDEERNFPDTDSTQTKGSPVLPATVDQSHGLDESRWSSLLSSQRAICVSSRSGSARLDFSTAFGVRARHRGLAIRSIPSRTRTDPR